MCLCVSHATSFKKKKNEQNKKAKSNMRYNIQQKTNKIFKNPYAIATDHTPKKTRLDVIPNCKSQIFTNKENPLLFVIHATSFYELHIYVSVFVHRYPKVPLSS